MVRWKGQRELAKIPTWPILRKMNILLCNDHCSQQPSTKLLLSCFFSTLWHDDFFFFFFIISFPGQDLLDPYQWACEEVCVPACKCMFFLEHQCEWTRLGEDEDRPSAVSSAGWRSRRLPLYPRFPGCRWSFRNPQKWHLHAASAPNIGTAAGRLAAHVLEAHRNQVRLQVREHHRLLPDLRGGHHWQLDAAQDHIQEQVHEERTQCPDWQPGSGRPAVYYHCHPNQCVQGKHSMSCVSFLVWDFQLYVKWWQQSEGTLEITLCECTVKKISRIQL